MGKKARETPRPTRPLRHTPTTAIASTRPMCIPRAHMVGARMRMMTANSQSNAMLALLSIDSHGLVAVTLMAVEGVMVVSRATHTRTRPQQQQEVCVWCVVCEWPAWELYSIDNITSRWWVDGCVRARIRPFADRRPCGYNRPPRVCVCVNMLSDVYKHESGVYTEERDASPFGTCTTDRTVCLCFGSMMVVCIGKQWNSWLPKNRHADYTVIYFHFFRSSSSLLLASAHESYEPRAASQFLRIFLLLFCV